MARPCVLLAQDVLTQRNNNLRTGATFSRGLNQDTVKNFQLLGALRVDSPVLAQPLFVNSVMFRGVQRSIVFVATAVNNIYAFNADPPFQQLGKLSLGAPYAPSASEVKDFLGGSALMTFVDGPFPGFPGQHPIVGIESTPVVDDQHSTMFASYRTHARPGGEQRLAAIDIRTLNLERDVAVPGPNIWHKLHRNRASLLLDHNVVYVAFAAIDEGKRVGDYAKSYQGWIHAFDAYTLIHLGAYRTVRDPLNRGDASDDSLDGGGIWQASTGPAADEGGDLFFATGNGAKNPAPPDDSGNNLSSSVVRLSANRVRVRAPRAAGDPATMVVPNQQHIFYRATDGSIQHIFWDSHGPPGQLYNDSWTGITHAPTAAGDPATMVVPNQQHIFYRATDGSIQHIFWDSHSPPGRLFHDSWTGITHAPTAAGDPATMVVPNQQHIFYRATDGSIQHIFWDSHSPPDQLFHDLWSVLPDRMVMTPKDWFTPYRKIWQDTHDMDFGASGAMLIPGTNFMAVAGKEGLLYLLDRNHLGKFDNQPFVGDCPLTGQQQDDPRRDHVVQKVRAGVNQYFVAENRRLEVCGPGMDWIQWPHVHGTIVFGDFGGGNRFLYVWPEKDHLKSFRWLGTRLATQPTTATALAPPWKDVPEGQLPFGQTGMPGGILSLTVDPERSNAGVLFASVKTCGDGTVWHECSTTLCGRASNLRACVNQDLGMLRAFDPISLHELWNNQLNTNASAADKKYRFAKFVAPTIARGRVFLATADNKVLVYGRQN